MCASLTILASWATGVTKIEIKLKYFLHELEELEVVKILSPTGKLHRNLLFSNWRQSHKCVSHILQKRMSYHCLNHRELNDFLVLTNFVILKR